MHGCRVRQQYVVGIEEQHHGAAAAGKSRIDAGTLTTVGFEDGDDTAAVRFDDRGGAVARAVVDDDDLAVGVVLGERTVDRFAEEVAVVVVRDDDTDENRPASYCKDG
jgi:hypothetical protein